MMRRDYHAWWSPSLRRKMELLVFGHAGARMLVFPTSKGKFYEWEDRGMIGALGESIERGWLQLICVDSVDAESWYAWRKHPGARIWRQVEYDRYLTDEVIPLSRHINGNPFLIATGASFGAYHAMNFGLRHPDLTGRIVAMSGLYDLRRWMRGYHDDNVYYNTPAAFIEHESDPHRLAQLRHLDVIIATGKDDPNRGASEHTNTLLWQKGIPTALRLWDGLAHDWPWWRDMITRYASGAD